MMGKTMEMDFRPIIGLKEDKCTGCLRCIRICPVKMCNDASKEGLVTFNGDLCIGCGECLSVCDPKAPRQTHEREKFYGLTLYPQNSSHFACPL